MCFRVKAWFIVQQFILHLSAYQSLVPEPLALVYTVDPIMVWHEAGWSVQ